jgi:hypothetical protein
MAVPRLLQGLKSGFAAVGRRSASGQNGSMSAEGKIMLCSELAPGWSRKIIPGS